MESLPLAFRYRFISELEYIINLKSYIKYLQAAFSTGGSESRKYSIKPTDYTRLLLKLYKPKIKQHELLTYPNLSHANLNDDVKLG